jgi:polysaccharide pyruvyl transferase WcaK-like protein
MKAREVFRKSLAVFMMVCIFVQTVSGVNTTKDIVIDKGVDKEKSQLIIAVLNSEEVITSRSIFCLLGHSIAQTTARETTHRYWATSPRCRQITYRVNYCTRSSCNYVTYTVIEDARVPCCS